jgi:5-methylcytosine-specific restriction endonuclease McrA
MKTCTRCGATKDLACFYPKSKSRGGLAAECKDCTKQRVAANYDPASNSAYHRERRVRKGEELRAYDRKRAMNSQRRADTIRRAAAWREANRERDRELKRRHKQRRRGADEETLAYPAVLLRDPCSYCGAPANSVDHVTPLSGGGLDNWENLTAACMECNRRKLTRPLLDFLVEAAYNLR